VNSVAGEFLPFVTESKNLKLVLLTGVIFDKSGFLNAILFLAGYTPLKTDVVAFILPYDSADGY
jgi:hypothetical protein